MTQAAHVSTFNYDNQEAWKDINFAAPVTNDCAKTANSPINVPASVVDTCDRNQVKIDVVPGDCKTSDLKFTVNDHSVKAEFVGNCTRPTAKFPDYLETYVAAQFHIHTSCEHEVDGKSCDAEFHIVHFSNDTDFSDFSTYKAAVIGVMITNDALEPNEKVQGMLDCWAKKHVDFVNQCSPATCDVSTLFNEAAATCDDAAFDVYGLIPKGSGYYNYMGGLTTPPCSQIVRWNLMDTYLSISLKQWSTLAQLILGYGGFVDDQGQCKQQYTVASKTGSTSREPQDLNGRLVKHRCNAV